MERQYTVVYTTVEDGWIMATAPDLPGAITQGRNLDEARRMIRDAIREMLAASDSHARRESPPEAIWETVMVDVPEH